ncbi:MAG: hypothetical protein Q7R76_05640 [Candidatus Woesearchaeota archaeon]|nr:hypothetical protein [Candidatus Woesearchaeota archaeon]
MTPAPPQPPPSVSPMALTGQRPMFEKKEPVAVAKEGLSELSQDVSNLSRRIMVLEERYANVRKKMQLTENSLLKLSKEITKEVRAVGSELTDYRREFMDLRDKVRLIVKELQDCAKSDEVRTLTTYIELWEPLHFVTRNEFDKAFEQLRADMLGKTTGLRESNEPMKLIND